MIRAAVALAAAGAIMPAMASDFSTRVDALWNFSDPAASEARFRAERANYSPSSREALEIDTQIARALGLQRRFDAAHATLDAVSPGLAAVDPRVRVRYLLERGRAYNSSGASDKAVPLFSEAATRGTDAGRPDDEYYIVDALHMLGIAAPPAERLSFNLKALAAADAATDARARNWRGSLLHNIGWTYFDAGDYATALGYWQRALAFREAAGDVQRTRVAKWTVARGLRALGRLAEAEAMQRSLADELAVAGETDGFVFEELAEIELARGNPAAAAPWAAKAWAALKDDRNLAANEPARLARLAALGNMPR